MKSLEIVNNTIVKQQTIEIKGTDRLPSIFVDDIRIAGVKWNDSPNVGYITAKLNTHSRAISMENLETIKQDLEAWNIIKKQLLRSKYGVYKSKINAVVEYNKITMREIKEDEFDREDFNKLKQWLEVNENDRNN